MFAADFWNQLYRRFSENYARFFFAFFAFFFFAMILVANRFVKNIR